MQRESKRLRALKKRVVVLKKLQDKSRAAQYKFYKAYRASPPYIRLAFRINHGGRF